MTRQPNDVSHVEEVTPTEEPLGSLSEKAGSHPTNESLDDDPVYTYAEQRKIIHRLDRRLISIAGIIYMNSLMDRSNLPNAAIAGMNADLDMNDGFRYVSFLFKTPTFRRRVLQLTCFPSQRSH